MTLRVKAIMNRVKGVNTKMNMIVSLMAADSRKRFSREEYRRIRKEASALFQELTEENKDLPKAMNKHLSGDRRIQDAPGPRLDDG